MLMQFIDAQEDLVSCGGADSASSALKMIPTAAPDIVIVDLTLKDSHGLDLVKDLRLHFPSLPVLVLSMHDESVFTERVLQAGAHGYITKGEHTSEFLAAVRKVLGGDIYVSERIAAHMVRKFVRGAQEPGFTTDTLSDRELQILQLIGSGFDARRIGDMLRLDPSTVNTYRMRLKRKLNLKTPAELLQYALRWNEAHL